MSIVLLYTAIFLINVAICSAFKVSPGKVYALRLPYRSEDTVIAAIGYDAGYPIYILKPQIVDADAEDVECYYEHDIDGLEPSDDLLATIVHEFEDVSLTQRICEDRTENPHGEHAEDVFILKMKELRRFLK